MLGVSSKVAVGNDLWAANRLCAVVNARRGEDQGAGRVHMGILTVDVPEDTARFAA